MVTRRLFLASAAASLAAPALANGESVWPQRPLKLVVPWPPGGGVDTFGRLVQAALSAALGQPVSIENIGGSFGRIGTLAAASQRPGRLNVRVPGLGNSQHLTSELLLRAAGDLGVTHVPYRGGGPLLQDLVAGTVDAAVVTFSAAAQQARAGSLVALAVTGAQRTAALPDVPTASETVAPGFVQTTWQGLLVPKGTPEPVRARLHAAMRVVLDDPVVVARLGEPGFAPIGQDGAAFAALIERSVQTFADIASARQIAAGD